MAKDNIGEYSSTAASNTVVGDVNIAEGTAPSNINNAIREVMSHLADAHGAIAAYQGVTNSITAGTTQTQGGATALTEPINRVTTVGTNGDGVKLPTATAGLSILVLNDDSAQTLKVWPNTSDAIDGGSANAVDANQIAAGASRLYVAIDATNWYTAMNDLGTIPLGVASGGTGAATLTDGGILLGSGTGAITATAVLADGEILVGDGTTDPVAESGATARTSLGLGTGDSPTFTAVTAGQVDVTAQGDVRFQDSSGGQYAAFQAPGTIASSHTYTWPASLPGGDRFLQSTDAGVLSWESITAGAITALNNATANELVTVGSTTTELDAESGLTFDGSTLDIGGEMDITTGGKIRGPNGTAGAPTFSFKNDTDMGLYRYGGDQLGIAVAGENPVMIQSTKMFINESSNTSGANSLTINQLAADEEILALKSSEISHGLSSVAETDTYGSFRKNDGGIRGGLAIYGMAESDYTGAGVELHAYSQGVDSASSTSATAVVSVRASKTSGTGGAALSSNANAFSIVASGNCQWICDAEGDTKYNGSDGAGAFDSWDDCSLLTTFRHVTVTDKKFAKKMFGNFVQENAEVLDKYGVITMNDDGNHFISTKGLNALVIDAIRQTRSIQKAFYNILSDEQKNKFAGELHEMKLPVLPAFQTPEMKEV